MTTIIKLDDDSTNGIPDFCAAFIVDDLHYQTHEAAIQEFTRKYGSVPEKAFRWRRYLFIEIPDKSLRYLYTLSPDRR